MSYLTVCTPTYNRAYCLEVPFNSLCNQTFKDFVWLVIDDGSTDNTEQLIETFRKKADFPIVYVKTENHGKAAALNESYKHIKTKYVINLDSDDEFTETALQKIYEAWESVPKEDYDRFFCVIGHCIDSKDRKLVGGMWPEGINALKGRAQRKEIFKHKKGEKICCRKVEILKQFPFPTPPNTKFLFEGTVWCAIEREYDQYCINDIIRVYHTESEDALTKRRDLSFMNARYYLSLAQVNNSLGNFTYNPKILKSILNVSKFGIFIKIPFRDMMRGISKIYKRLFVALGYPIMWVYNKIHYKEGK